ncbi:MAG: PadR family transcriptional regulator [Candidatus Heimdallarchaeota archaeon]|nr:PadR family transcriptional regulator [Candidatus Heimdallarchaeota archaeon]
MIGKDLDVTPMEAFFLMVLNTPESLSGSEIVLKIKENLGLNWTPSAGATYKILQSMEKKQFIQETTKEEDRNDQRLRTYNLSEKGKEILPIIASRIIKIALFVDSCCPQCSTEDGVIVKIVKKE